MSIKGKLGLTGKFVVSGLYEVVQRSWATAHASGLLTEKKAPIPVISVGAIAIGGSGKTPVTMFIAGKLKAFGYSPVICSRGYKGAYRGSYCVVSNGRSSTPLVTPKISGDEPYLMASRLETVPVVVARRRIDAVRASVERLDCDVAILDDGFQHLGLYRNINLVLLNAQKDWMFPRGRLREPFGALNRADAILLSGSAEELPPEAKGPIGKKPVFKMVQEADSIIHGVDHEESSLDLFKDRAVFLVSGIANPERFEKMSRQLGWDVVEHAIFRDHERVSDDDLAGLISRAGNQPIVLTEKDWVKAPEWFRRLSNSYYLRIKVSIEHEPEFLQLLIESVQKHES